MHPAQPLSPWSPDKKHSDRESYRWICVYPAYINSKKTLAQGRKIAKEDCVENPTHQEMRDVLLAAGLKVGVESKLYSRERSKELQHRGRVRVQIKNDDGSPCDAKFGTRESVLRHLGEMIPKLKTRQNKGGSEVSQSGVAKGKNKGKGKR